MYVRKPVVAGSFYPSTPKTVEKEVDGYLKSAQKQKISGEIVGIISPHAGYIYSAPVAAYSYNQLTGKKIDLAVVLAPSHRARFNGASILPSGIYETPLGGVEIDRAVGEKLVNKSHFDFIEQAHGSEHSLEVQVPFLQRVLGKFSIVPIVLGTTEIEPCMAIAEEIYDCLKDEIRNIVVVISTDLSHYHSYETAKKLDNIFIESLKTFDEKAIYDTLNGGKAEACGQGPVLAGCFLCRKLGASRVEILNYANSGDTAGPRDQVVGYLAAALVK
ncbi:MAG: AmmeMemoRadiSam system protein B [Spirochaetes bacterium]|nr:AmmeMemoRadiSam system protein B [Spirochaetota bacterium]